MLETLDYKWVLASLAMVISFANLFYYISTVIKGQIRPHMYTWLIWGLVTVVAAITQLISGGGAGAFFTCLVAFNCLTIAMLAYFKGEKDIQKSDKICLAGCLIAIALWPLTAAPVLSLIIVTLIDTAGFYPTIRKSYIKPHEENLRSFALYGITYSMGVLALHEYNFLTVLYPLVVAITSLGLALMLLVRRKQLGHKVWA